MPGYLLWQKWDGVIVIERLRIRPGQAGDTEPLLELWERSVRATHHFLVEADIADAPAWDENAIHFAVMK